MDRDFLEELFEPVGRVAFRRMFGGLGVYRDGLMFGLVADDVLHLKVDDTNRSEFEAEGSAPFSYETRLGRRTIGSFWRLPERLFDDPDELRLWALKAVECAKRADQAKASKPKR